MSLVCYKNPGSETQQASGKAKNSLLTGKNLECTQAHVGALLLIGQSGLPHLGREGEVWKTGENRHTS